MRPCLKRLCCLFAIRFLNACTQVTSPDSPPLPWAQAFLPEVQHPPDNPSSPEKVALGQALFHDPILSADRKTACVTCHSQYWGMSDGLSVSIGVGGEGMTGPGRRGGTPGRRNAPTLWNVGLRAPLFWDGRANSLEEQVLGPLENVDELGRNRNELIDDLKKIPAYVLLFEKAFPESNDPVRIEHVQKAIAAYERTIISNNAPYDRYMRGDLYALSDDEKEGMRLFAEAQCNKCHIPPKFFSDGYARAYVPKRYAQEPEDLGRFEISKNDADRGMFRIPSLRNARETGPYFHNGSVPSLREAVDWMVKSFSTKTLTSEEIGKITVFIEKSLTDRTHEPARLREVPSKLSVPLDGFTFPR